MKKMQTLRRIIISAAAVCLLGASAMAHPGAGILVDRLGQVYFIDTGSGLWKFDTRDELFTVPCKNQPVSPSKSDGPPPLVLAQKTCQCLQPCKEGSLESRLTHLSPLRNHWLAMDPYDRFKQANLPTDPGRDWVITAAGSNPTILISTDFPLVIGQDGKLYYPSVRSSDRRILSHDGAGGITTFATLPRSAKGESWINGLAAGPNGSLYYTDDATIGRITAQGAVSTFATVQPLANGPRIPGSEMKPYLRGLKVDAKGVVYVADAGDARVLKIMPDGKLSTILQLESPWAPTDVAIFGDIVYVLEFSHTEGDDRTEWMPRIRKITPDGRSAVILTVDQMPNARPSKRAASVSSNHFWIPFVELLVRSFIYSI